MKFCINVSNSLKTINYRLKKDGLWKKCLNTRKVSNDDMIFSDIKKVYTRQKNEEKIIIEDKEYNRVVK